MKGISELREGVMRELKEGVTQDDIGDGVNQVEGNTFDELRREWTDISSEDYRVYNFGERGQVHIDNPHYLNVSKSGGHRVLDRNGVSYYIPSGWLNIQWAGHPAFVK